MNWMIFLRLQRGLSQRELATRLDVDPSILCKIERGWFARPPGDLETKLKTVFGNSWTFRKLMEPVPNFAEMREKEA